MGGEERRSGGDDDEDSSSSGNGKRERERERERCNMVMDQMEEKRGTEGGKWRRGRRRRRQKRENIWRTTRQGRRRERETGNGEKENEFAASCSSYVKFWVSLFGVSTRSERHSRRWKADNKCEADKRRDGKLSKVGCEEKEDEEEEVRSCMPFGPLLSFDMM